MGLGQANTGNFDQNPGRQLLWVYYFIETFLISIVSFNMLIAILGETFSDVMDQRERNILMMQTQIYSEYLSFLNWIEKDKPRKFNRRYLYIA